MIDLLVFSHSCFTAINRSVYQLLRKKGWKVEIVAPVHLWDNHGKKIKAHPAREEDPPMHFLELSHKQHLSRIYQFVGQEKILDTLKPAMIYCENGTINLMAYKLGKWAKKNNCTLVCQTVENLSIHPVDSLKRLGFKSLPVAFLKYAIMLLVRPLVHQVLTINDSGTRIFKELGFKNVDKTPLGYNPEVFYPSEEVRRVTRKELELDNEVPVIAYIGRMVPQKGLHLLMEALGQLKDFQWYLLMDKFLSKKGPYFERLKSLEDSYSLGERIRYIEADHFEIARYMNAADVVVIPSTSTKKWVEQYGRVAPEAMACGKLVMASDTGALPELVGDAGILFKENNIAALKKVLEAYLKNPQAYSGYPEKAMKRASENLSIHSQAELLHNLLIKNQQKRQTG